MNTISDNVIAFRSNTSQNKKYLTPEQYKEISKWGTLTKYERKIQYKPMDVYLRNRLIGFLKKLIKIA